MSTPRSNANSTTMDELTAAQLNEVTAPSSAGQNPSTSEVEIVETVALAVPTEPRALKNYLNRCTREIIGPYAQQLKAREGKIPIPLNSQQKNELTLVLRALANIQGLTPALEKAIGLKVALELVMDLPSTSQYQFPAPFPEMAKAAHRKFEAEAWGNNDEIRDDQDNANNVNTATASASTATPISTQSSAPTPTIVIRRPNPNHPIYGVNGIMHGILVDRSGKMITYKLDDSQPPHRSGKVFGHNGLANGQWWPLQICALRDGAHGMRMGGIAGSPTYGAYSIIVSGLYADLDADYGDRLYYSGSQSHDNTDPNTPVLSNATKALQRSRENGKVVRVLRASGGESYYCPSVGLRYDGLYQVGREETKINRRGGAYLRFRLERVAGQPPIDRSRPTVAEKRDYDCVRSYY